MKPPPTAHDRELWLNHGREVRDLARKSVDDKIATLEGSRQMFAYQNLLHAGEDEESRVFLGIDTESDHLPLGRARDHLSASVLREKDREIKGCEDLHRARAVKAAIKICDECEEDQE